MTYVLEPIANDDLPKILADAESNTNIIGIRREFRDGVKPEHEWAIDREVNSYLFHSSWFDELKESSQLGFMFYYKNRVFGVHLKYHGVLGLVSLDRGFKSSALVDLDFQRAFSEAYDVAYKRWFCVRPVFGEQQQDKE
jgi:hypothetical protein